MVVGVPRASGLIVVAVTERACCRVTVGGGAIGCVDTPCGLVACVGEAMLARFYWPWATNDAGDGALIRSSPC